MGIIIVVTIWTGIPYVGGTIFLIGAISVAGGTTYLYFRHTRRVKEARIIPETSIEMSQNIISVKKNKYNY